MRVLIVHNLLWAHYKALIFNQLQVISDSKSNDSFLVIQLAATERSRKEMGKLDVSQHQYNYELLHDGLIEDTTFWVRLMGCFKIIRKMKPDVINITGYSDFALWIVIIYCKFKGIKTILSNESTAGDHHRNKLYEYLKALFITKFDGYFNFGTRSKNYLISLGAEPEKMLVNRNCVDNNSIYRIYQSVLSEKPKIKAELNLSDKNFIFVGRLIEQKNLFRMLEAFKIANEKAQEKWGMIILGDGELESELLDYVVHNKLSNVSFQHGVSWDKVPYYLALGDVLVLPSISETWGLVVNEAMVCGLPVIVSENCGCTSDLVQNNKNGFTFSPLDVNQLSEIFLKFITKDVHKDKMGALSKLIINDYSLENVAKEMYDSFISVTNKK